MEVGVRYSSGMKYLPGHRRMLSLFAYESDESNYTIHCSLMYDSHPHKRSP